MGTRRRRLWLCVTIRPPRCRFTSAAESEVPRHGFYRTLSVPTGSHFETKQASDHTPHRTHPGSRNTTGQNNGVPAAWCTLGGIPPSPCQHVHPDTVEQSGQSRYGRWRWWRSRCRLPSMFSWSWCYCHISYGREGHIWSRVAPALGYGGRTRGLGWSGCLAGVLRGVGCLLLGGGGGAGVVVGDGAGRQC